MINKNEPFPKANQDLSDFLNEFAKESDRALAVLSAAQMDDIIYKILLKKLCPSPFTNLKKDELFSGSEALSTFSSRINLCFRIGLISTEFRSILNTIKKIRNEFAHKRASSTLNNDRYTSMVGSMLEYYHDESIQHYRDKYFEGSNSNTSNFSIVAGLVYSSLQELLTSTTEIQADPMKPDYKK